MNAYMVWLKTEFKRVARRLPSLFIGAIVLALLVSATAFCAFTVTQLRGDRQAVTAKVAVSAPEDALTDMVIHFVVGMDSLTEWCTFERYSLEEGLEALKKREVVAVISLPDDVVTSILNGTNVPAMLYLPQGQELSGILIESMAKAGISLLQVAQAEIYATSDLYLQYPLGQPLGDLYGEINLYNLNIVLSRENLFKTISLSETDGISMEAYFGATALAMFALLLGLLTADLLVENSGRERLLHVSRVSVSAQIMGRWKVLTGTGFLWTFAGTCVLSVWMNADKQGIGTILRWCVKNSLSLLLAVACIVAVELALGAVISDKMAYMFVLGLSIPVLGYIGGYFIPSNLLGEQIRKIGSFLPTTYLHDICSSMLAGRDLSDGYLCLFVWLIGSLSLCALLRRRRCLR